MLDNIAIRYFVAWQKIFSVIKFSSVKKNFCLTVFFGVINRIYIGKIRREWLTNGKQNWLSITSCFGNKNTIQFRRLRDEKWFKKCLITIKNLNSVCYWHVKSSAVVFATLGAVFIKYALGRDNLQINVWKPALSTLFGRWRVD